MRAVRRSWATEQHPHASHTRAGGYGSTSPTLPDGATLRTLDKGLTILETLASIGREGTTSVALGRRPGLHRTTVHRFLQTLTRRGYAEQISESDRYRLGLAALRLASASMTGLTLRDVGIPVLEALRRVAGETVQTVILDPAGDVVTIDRLDADHPIGLRTLIGARRPAYCSAAGKALLAFRPESDVDAWSALARAYGTTKLA